MLTDIYAEIVRAWWESFSRRFRSRGNITGGLVLLENLRTELDFSIEGHKAAGSDQLKNATAKNVSEILARFGETRVLSREGGRTNRGLMRNLTPFLDALAASDITLLSPKDRAKSIDTMQLFLVEQAKEILNADRISFEYNPSASSRETIGRILRAAGERQKTGEVAEYLVGAKLALRFPSINVRNSAASAADDQANEHGDFQINDCIFHVTVSPNRGHYDKCKQNYANGFRIFLLVTEARLIGARQTAEQEIGDTLAVESIESFVSQNIEELSEFGSNKVAQNVKMLLEKYNERVGEVESDLSLMIHIPVSLEK